MAPKQSRPRNLYQFHYGSQLFSTETRSERQLRLAFQTRTRAETERSIRRNQNPRNGDNRAQDRPPADSHPETGTDLPDQLGFDEGPSLWEDTEEIMNEEDEASRARLRSLHQEMIQQQRHRNWNDIMAWLFPSYLHFKKLTSDWTLPTWNDNLSAEVCKCPAQSYKQREVDLIDLMGKFFLDSLIHSLIVIDIQVFCFSGQRRVKFAFCACTPDPVHLLASGYLASTPVFPQTAFSVRLLNFYDILWNICNAHTTPFAKVLQRWNESRSIRLHAKNSTKARELRRNLVAAIDAYRTLKDMQRKLVQNMTSINRQEVLAQQSCPACFGVALQDPNPAEPPPADSADNHKVFICLDGNFQHRHHERESKNYIGIQNQSLFVRPEEIDVSNQEIREGELAKRVSKKAVRQTYKQLISTTTADINYYLHKPQKDRCTEQHKAADDRRNASSWKGCDDTGLFGCCCRHDSVISFCNIHKSGEGCGLPMSIIKRFFNAINPNIEVGLLYDIGCTLKKFFQARGLLTDHLPRMKFATAVFHSYVHDWPCQLQFNPRYNEGWGLTDGEGLERLWSYLSPLVSPLRYISFKEAEATVHKMLREQNPHKPGENYTIEFFRAQWQKQRDFEMDRNQADRDNKIKQAQFFERGEALKTLAETFLAKLASSTPHSDPTHALSTLQEIQDLQELQDEEAEKLGTLFVFDEGAERNRQ
ncbi:hypothetical protein PGTUg99_004216 [Puccinia graminis f. sp. tritici]|uniref:CxC1-like cysteine cluster associated with KDZ transposases domain-containing protein n=1 Tax=Puccinia graminis f. sp. tritici TaxID=56615 RepID=A0A5B0M2N9_PUCGR|nr:hypothetical protein PGTUg99_004216 [Puccinia graminis f. sp. tritici]